MNKKLFHLHFFVNFLSRASKFISSYCKVFHSWFPGYYEQRPYKFEIWNDNLQDNNPFSKSKTVQFTKYGKK
jgi:hypothetical protein